MNTISPDYPREMSTEDLVNEIRTLAKHASVGANSSEYVKGPSYWKEMCELGQNELLIRSQESLNEEIAILKSEINQLRINNKRANRTNGFLSLLTILLAGVTIFIGYLTLQFAESDQLSDSKWQKEQLELLRNNNILFQEFLSSQGTLKVDTLKNE